MEDLSKHQSRFALILSNTGGLRETTNHALILDKINEKDLFNKIELLIKNKKLRNDLQKKTYKNFKLTNINSSKLIDKLRNDLFDKKINLLKNFKKPLKILHITNFNSSLMVVFITILVKELVMDN